LWLLFNSLLRALTIAEFRACIALIPSSFSPGRSVSRKSGKKGSAHQMRHETESMIRSLPGFKRATAEKSPNSFSVSLSSAMLFAKENAAVTSFFSHSSAQFHEHNHVRNR
jgi:hypothetical protein